MPLDYKWVAGFPLGIQRSLAIFEVPVLILLAWHAEHIACEVVERVRSDAPGEKSRDVGKNSQQSQSSHRWAARLRRAL